jgi:murein DD-endopeptidase MepM/ murein hydrolase activator NlpD
MGKFKLYHYSTKTLKFAEARWAKTKLAALSLTVGIALVTAVVEVNQYMDDGLGLGFGRASVLAAENSILRDQLRVFSSRLAVLDRELTSLNDQGNEFRVLVDLPKIDEDTRRAGTGGTDDRVDFGTSPEVNQLLRNLHATAERAERELQLQSNSYEEVVKRYETNKVRFAHLPAVKPMEGYYSANGFGPRLHPVLRIIKPHEGVDIANDVGSPVYATADGVVEFSGHTGGGYGNLVELNHGYGYTTAYAHLSKVLVREGQKVKRGDLIARSGRTGLVSGPHLHYEVRFNGIRQNPIDYFFDDVNYQEYKNQQLVFD